ncbi:MAG: HIT family protein [Zetaproteobacteria bacterium]|nr:HIT family protein [Zetaproteobacteria bacterium]
MPHKKCVFCDVVTKQQESYVFWEDEGHMAFLSRHPNTKGFSFVIPKEHYPNDPSNVDETIFLNLMLASKQASRLLASGLAIANCSIIIESYGVNHLHSKLFPMHGTSPGQPWYPTSLSPTEKIYPEYPGYTATNQGPKAAQIELELTLAEIINNNF